MSPSSPEPRRIGVTAAVAIAAALAGCAAEPERRDAVPQNPAVVRTQIASLMPASAADRPGWATDVYAALASLGIPATLPNLCAVLAVVEQESSYRADPSVPNLGRLAREEIERRAERAGVPQLAVSAALGLSSPTGRSYAERIEAARTERELSGIFDDFIDMVPLGKRLLAGWNPVRTGGPMQVSIAFAEDHARRRPYPYPMAGSVRDEVFSRRGGLYFGIAHLLDYPASYDRPLYRFADFNAGRYASRNAAFQSALAVVSGIPLDLDGDLIRHDADRDAKPGATELAARVVGRRIGMGDAEIRRTLEQGDSREFEGSALYRRVFELADGIERRALPRAVVPKIALKSPKITRNLTTEWFATRVDERHRRCVERGGRTAAEARS
ncbi:MAG TPA: DUF1615 domain-containing protein [Burkholderiaceae bacterium]|nr:DUF1615 domain-containing protein [Burkholderiaceae bacterium]